MQTLWSQETSVGRMSLWFLTWCHWLLSVCNLLFSFNLHLCLCLSQIKLSEGSRRWECSWLPPESFQLPKRLCMQPQWHMISLHTYPYIHISLHLKQTVHYKSLCVCVCICIYMLQLSSDCIAFLEIKAINHLLKTFKTFFNFKTLHEFSAFLFNIHYPLKHDKNKVLLAFKRCWIWFHYWSNWRTWPLASISSLDFSHVRLFPRGTVFIYVYLYIVIILKCA